MSVFTIRQAHEELESVWKFQKHAQLSGVRMKGFCASSAEKEPEVTDGLQLDLKHSVPRVEVEGNSAYFDVKLQIEALADKDPAKMLFHVDCCFELTYTLAPDYLPTEGDLEAFQKGNAVFHSWPYMREFVQNATQRMGLSVPPIPLLRLEPLPPAGAGENTPVQAPPAAARRRAPRRVKPAEKS
ncbi:MAG: hypothetical protein P4M04_12850 [Acidobacteriota bacterium]|nr:hypothetical protein [Acidobacteriota bacterium]